MGDLLSDRGVHSWLQISCSMWWHSCCFSTFVQYVSQRLYTTWRYNNNNCTYDCDGIMITFLFDKTNDSALPTLILEGYESTGQIIIVTYMDDMWFLSLREWLCCLRIMWSPFSLVHVKRFVDMKGVPYDGVRHACTVLTCLHLQVSLYYRGDCN